MKRKEERVERERDRKKESKKREKESKHTAQYFPQGAGGKRQIRTTEMILHLKFLLSFSLVRRHTGCVCVALSVCVFVSDKLV